MIQLSHLNMKKGNRMLSDILNYDEKSKAKINREIFLNIAQMIQTSEFAYSFDDIHRHLNYNIEALNKSLADHKDYFEVKLRKGADKQTYTAKDLFFKLNKQGINLFFECSNIGA